MPPRAVIVDHGDDHQLIGTGRLDQWIEPRTHRRDGPGEDALPIEADAFLVARRIRIGCRLLRACERKVLALLAADGKNGFRVPSAKGKSAHSEANYEGARIRSKFSREMFHPALTEAAWNAFAVGDYDTAIFEAFKSIEVAVRTKGGFASTDFGAALMKKAFDPQTGPLRDQVASPGRRKARCELFTGAFGEIRNPKGHNDPTITDALVAAEELMLAGVLRRIVDNA
jgi:uncharacterized protein (TIGR02391 family)